MMYPHYVRILDEEQNSGITLIFISYEKFLLCERLRSSPGSSYTIDWYELHDLAFPSLNLKFEFQARSSFCLINCELNLLVR